MRPLDGIRVLDFTWVVAGPVTTRILADLGADVIKVERRGSLDFGDRRGGLSGTLMRGKRSLLLDLNDPRGLDLACHLATVSDVVIDNFSARVMTNLGLDYDALAALKPDIICVRMTGFGLTGPDRDHVSYGPTLQALTGYTLLMAEPGGRPAGLDARRAVRDRRQPAAARRRARSARRHLDTGPARRGGDGGPPAREGRCRSRRERRGPLRARPAARRPRPLRRRLHPGGTDGAHRR